MAELLPSPRPAPAEPLLVGLVAAVAYGLLHQAAVHGTDWRWFVLWLDEPGTVHGQHVAYLPAGRLLRWLLQPWSFDAYGALAVLSAVGGGMAVACTHVASWRLSGDRAFTRASTLAIAVVPAWFHFATVVELHAPFAAAVAAAAAVAVPVVRGGGVAAALRLGSASGFAAAWHATGNLLLPLLAIALWLGGGGRRLPPRLGELLALGLGHFGVWGLAGWLGRRFGTLPAAVAGAAAKPEGGMPVKPWDYLQHWFATADLSAQAPPTMLHEWLQPFLPWSVLVLAAGCHPGLRRWCGALVLACLGYLVVATALLHAVTDERGAYLVPLALPAVWLSLAVVPRRAWWALLALAVGCGIWQRGEPDRQPPDLAFGRAAVAMAAAGPTRFFVADLPELDGLWRVDPTAAPRVARKELDDLRANPALAALEREPAAIAGWLAGIVLQDARNHGQDLVVTDAAVAWFTARVPAFADGWAQFCAVSGAERLPASAGIAGVRISR